MEKTQAELEAEAKIAAEKKAADEKKHTDWFNSLPADAQKAITDLREENKRNRVEKSTTEKELEAARQRLAEVDKATEAQAKEQGKFRELYEKAVPELEAKKALEARIKSLETVFTAQLEEEMKILPDAIQGIIRESGKPVEQMLTMARELKATISKDAAGLGSSRAGGGQPLNMDEYEKIYRDKAKLLELRDRDKPLYDRIIAQFKRK